MLHANTPLCCLKVQKKKRHIIFLFKATDLMARGPCLGLVGGGVCINSVRDYGTGAAPFPLTVHSATQILMLPVGELQQQACQRFV